MNVSKAIGGVVLIAVLMVVMAGAGFAQDDAVTVGSILKDAGKPLSDEQVTKVKAFKVGADMEVFMTLQDLFTAEQDAALKEALGVQQGFQGGEQPANLFFVMLFENEGCPLTKGQIEKLKEIDMSAGPGAFEEMQAIYTDEQSDVMMNMMPQ